MENTAVMTNSELLATFYAQALTLGIAIGNNEESFTDTLNQVQELWNELSKRFIKPQEVA